MIGVFDSGFGGLTILRALDRLPGRPDLIYLGDNARAPYGQRGGAEVVALTRIGVEHLFSLGCRLVILGCNTAAVVALRRLQQDWLPHRPGPRANILGIVVPTIEAATGLPWHEVDASPPDGGARGPAQDIALFATTRTIESGVYQTEIAKRRPDIRVHGEACPGLASAIEAGAPRSSLRALVDLHVSALAARLGGRLPDRAILGCTHYPLIADLFAEALGPKVAIVEQPRAVADALADYLIRHPDYARPGAGRRRFLSTGFHPEALRLAEAFWGGPLDFETADLPAPVLTPALERGAA